MKIYSVFLKYSLDIILPVFFTEMKKIGLIQVIKKKFYSSLDYF